MAKKFDFILQCDVCGERTIGKNVGNCKSCKRGWLLKIAQVPNGTEKKDISKYLEHLLTVES